MYKSRMVKKTNPQYRAINFIKPTAAASSVGRVLFCFERKSFNRACCCCSAIGTERGGGERERVDLISTHLQPTAIYH
ncbi:Type II methyltransferase M.AvaI [Trichinella pseudospiralis]